MSKNVHETLKWQLGYYRIEISGLGTYKTCKATRLAKDNGRTPENLLFCKYLHMKR